MSSSSQAAAAAAAEVPEPRYVTVLAAFLVDANTANKASNEVLSTQLVEQALATIKAKGVVKNTETAFAHYTAMIPLFHHLNGEANNLSPFYVAMRKSVLEAMRVFMLDLTEAINIRDGVARPFYTFLIDPKSYPLSLSFVMDVMVRAQESYVRVVFIRVLYDDLFSQSSLDVPLRLINQYLRELLVVSKQFSDRLYVLTRLEIKYFKKFLSLLKDLASEMQTEEELALLLIKNILPPVLDSIAKLSSWRSNTYARKYKVFTTQLLYFVANLCACTVPCQEAIAHLNPVRPMFPLLSDPDLTHAAWHTVNWCIIPDEAKIDFIKLGGAELIAKELGEKNLSSTNVIYVARKVAMLAETRRKLIDNGVLQFLIKYRSKAENDVKLLFVICLTLSFVVLENEEPWVTQIEALKAKDLLVEATQHLYTRSTKKGLGVLYVEMLHCRKLMTSKCYASQCFGTWWVLHLLSCYRVNEYDRDYVDMAFRDNITKVLISLIEENTPSSFLFKLCAESLYHLSYNPSDKIRLIEVGMLRVFNKLLEADYEEAQPMPSLDAESPDEDDLEAALPLHKNYARRAVMRMLSDPGHYRPRRLTTLTALVEDYICLNTDRDDFALVVDLSEIHSFKRLQLFFLASIFQDGVTERDCELVQDELPRSVLKALLELDHEDTSERLFRIKARLKDERPEGSHISQARLESLLKACVRFSLLDDAKELLLLASLVQLTPSQEFIDSHLKPIDSSS